MLVSNQYYQLMLTLVPIWAVMGLSWNILSGYSGLISFGHAAFFGLGAYTVTLMLVRFDMTPWFGIPRAMLVGALAAGDRLSDVPSARPLFRAVDARLSAGAALLFEWLGYQEVALPMKRTAPGWYMQFADYRVYIVDRARSAGRRAAGLAGGRALALRHVAAGDQAERAGGRGSRHRHAALEDARDRPERRAGGRGRRALRRGAAGGHARRRVRHAHLGAGAGGRRCSAASARCGGR